MTATQARPIFTPENCNITIECEPEFIPIKGNAIASGGDTTWFNAETRFFIDTDGHAVEGHE